MQRVAVVIGSGANATSAHSNAIVIGHDTTSNGADSISFGSSSPTNMNATASAWGQIFQNRDWSNNTDTKVAGINIDGNLINGVELGNLENVSTATANVGDVLTWYLDTDAGFLVIDSSSGVLSGTPDNDDVGSYWVNVSVFDVVGGYDYSLFTLVVGNSNDAPVITTVDVTSVLEDVLYWVDYDADDPDSLAASSTGGRARSRLPK